MLMLLFEYSFIHLLTSFTWKSNKYIISHVVDSLSQIKSKEQ
uniref:Uncharacterized protein n=1 Tax=Heterorhabditis bacteriophora TaxID=37862 RepID=A0A1I7WA80_HETBA